MPCCCLKTSACERLRLIDMPDNEQATYRGIPVEHIAIMYDYLKNHDGAIDGGFAEGFLAGAEYAAAKIQEGMLKAAERTIMYGVGKSTCI